VPNPRFEIRLGWATELTLSFAVGIFLNGNEANWLAEADGRKLTIRRQLANN